MKKTTYAIMGLIASGFVIILGLMLVARAISKPYPEYYYYDDSPAGIKTTVEAVDTVVEAAEDTVLDNPELIP